MALKLSFSHWNIYNDDSQKPKSTDTWIIEVLISSNQRKAIQVWLNDVEAKWEKKGPRHSLLSALTHGVLLIREKGRYPSSAVDLKVGRAWLFCDPKDSSPSSSLVHGILQARVLEWVAISSSRGSHWCLLHWQVILYHWATREAFLGQ